MQMQNNALVKQTQDMMWVFVEMIMLYTPKSVAIDRVLMRWSKNPALFDHAMCIAPIAGTGAQRVFRKHIILAGDFARAIRLEKLMGIPFDRLEIIELGNSCSRNITKEEADLFLYYAKETGAMLPIDLKRLEKQLSRFAI